MPDNVKRVDLKQLRKNYNNAETSNDKLATGDKLREETFKQKPNKFHKLLGAGGLPGDTVKQKLGKNSTSKYDNLSKQEYLDINRKARQKNK